MKHIRKNLKTSTVFVLFFLLYFCLLFHINTTHAAIWKNVFDQMGALSEKSGYSESAIPVPIEEIVANIIQYALSFLGVIFIILIIYAGFLWMTASGDSDKITKAKGILINAIIGVIIVLGAYVITAFIFSRLGGATGTG